VPSSYGVFIQWRLKTTINFPWLDSSGNQASSKNQQRFLGKGDMIIKRSDVGTFVTYALKHRSLNPTDPTKALDSSVRAEIS
jgi:hypothetical protein